MCRFTAIVFGEGVCVDFLLFIMLVLRNMLVKVVAHFLFVSFVSYRFLLLAFVRDCAC